MMPLMKATVRRHFFAWRRCNRIRYRDPVTFPHSFINSRHYGETNEEFSKVRLPIANYTNDQLNRIKEIFVHLECEIVFVSLLICYIGLSNG